ncbi:MAG: hypothetical protein U1E20_00325 [Methylocystis sp.]|uniref:hypothetical protein n=1 Tax=Methylocystis sp. TaxID=1911079 RepID=UPI0039573A18
MQMKKPAWSSMPVLDVRQLKKPQLDALANAYDAVSKKELGAIAHLHTDATRHEIDAALEKALSLPNLSPIRELLAREPGLSAEDIAAATDEAEDEDQEEVTEALERS